MLLTAKETYFDALNLYVVMALIFLESQRLEGEEAQTCKQLN